MRFAMKKIGAKIAHLNTRGETHGDDTVLACDVTITADMPQDFLEQLAPGLKAALYMVNPEQPQLEQPDTHADTVRFPQLGAQSWPGEFKAELVIHGAKKDQDKPFTDARVKKLTFEPKNGGSVSVKFQCAVHPGADGLQSLGDVLGKNVKISVKPGAEEDGGEGEPAGGDPLTE